MVFAISDPLGGPGKVKDAGPRGVRQGRVGGARRLGALVLLVGLVAMLLGAALPMGAAAAATDPLTELATKYAPIVVARDQTEPCGDGEPYRPTPVTTVLGNPEVVLRGPDGEQVAGPTAADLVGKGEGWYLDYPGNPLDPGCTYDQWFRTASDGGAAHSLRPTGHRPGAPGQGGAAVLVLLHVQRLERQARGRLGDGAGRAAGGLRRGGARRHPGERRLRPARGVAGRHRGTGAG